MTGGLLQSLRLPSAATSLCTREAYSAANPSCFLGGIPINVRYMTLSSLFAALLAICAWICIPAGDISFTMQTFGMALALLLLGGKWGTVSIGIYLLLGAVGLPVFSGFRGGFGILLGVTGGFLWGFLLSGLVFRLLEGFSRPLALICSLFTCYFCGCGWFLFWSGGGLGFVLLRCVVPFLIPDIIKLWLAYSLSKRLKKVIFVSS